MGFRADGRAAEHAGDAKEIAMRMQAELPKYVCLRVNDGDTMLAFLCPCGDATAQEVHARLDETGSSAEARCPRCRRFIQVRCSVETREQV